MCAYIVGRGLSILSKTEPLERELQPGIAVEPIMFAGLVIYQVVPAHPFPLPVNDAPQLMFLIPDLDFRAGVEILRLFLKESMQPVDYHLAGIGVIKRQVIGWVQLESLEFWQVLVPFLLKQVQE
jgi:hypothetical protein